MPVRCFTCGKVVGNMYDNYIEKCNSGIESAKALDELKLGRPCCRRMLATHVDVLKYQLLYPTYEDGVQRLGVPVYENSEEETDSPTIPKTKNTFLEGKTKTSKNPQFISLDDTKSKDIESADTESEKIEEILLIEDGHSITADEIDNIKSCIGQFIENNFVENECSVINVFDKSAANKYLKTLIDDGTYTVMKKNVNQYKDRSIVNRIRKIWAEGLYPIEIIIGDNGFFFAVPQEAIFMRIVESYEMLEAEEKIPSLDDF